MEALGPQRVDTKVAGRLIWASTESICLLYKQWHAAFDPGDIPINLFRDWFRLTWHHIACQQCKTHALRHLDKVPLQFLSPGDLSTSLRHLYNSVRSKLSLPQISHDNWQKDASARAGLLRSSPFRLRYLIESKQETTLRIEVTGAESKQPEREHQPRGGSIPVVGPVVFSLPEQEEYNAFWEIQPDIGILQKDLSIPLWCKIVLIEHIWINLWNFEDWAKSGEQDALRQWVEFTLNFLFFEVPTFDLSLLSDELGIPLSFLTRQAALESFLKFWNCRLRGLYGTGTKEKTFADIKQEQQCRVTATRCVLEWPTPNKSGEKEKEKGEKEEHKQESNEIKQALENATKKKKKKQLRKRTLKPNPQTEDKIIEHKEVSDQKESTAISQILPLVEVLSTSDISVQDEYTPMPVLMSPCLILLFFYFVVRVVVSFC